MNGRAEEKKGDPMDVFSPEKSPEPAPTTEKLEERVARHGRAGRFATIMLASATLVGGYMLGHHAGFKSGYVRGHAPIQQLATLTQYKAAPGFLDHSKYAVRVALNKEGKVEMYFQNRESKAVVPINDQTVRFEKAYQEHPTLLSNALSLAEKMP